MFSPHINCCRFHMDCQHGNMIINFPQIFDISASLRCVGSLKRKRSKNDGNSDSRKKEENTAKQTVDRHSKAGLERRVTFSRIVIVNKPTTFVIIKDENAAALERRPSKEKIINWVHKVDKMHSSSVPMDLSI